MRKTLNADPLDSSTGNDISPSVKAPEKHIDCCPWRRTLFALSGRDANSNYFLAAYVPILVFWYPDAFCLMQERLYRSLYEKVRSQTEDEIDFSMNAAADEFQTKKTTIPNCFLSKTILRFCLPPAIVTAGIIYICSAPCASEHECSFFHALRHLPFILLSNRGMIGVRKGRRFLRETVGISGEMFQRSKPL